MKYVILVVVVVLVISFLGYFVGKRTEPTEEVPKVVKNIIKPDPNPIKEIHELGKKTEEWEYLLAQLEAFLSSVSKEMQDPSPNKKMQ